MIDEPCVNAPRPTCGAPCPNGGKASARKYSRSDLAWWGHCNRAVRRAGDRCWQHGTQVRTCCLYEREGKPVDDYCRANCPGFTPGHGGAA